MRRILPLVLFLPVLFSINLSSQQLRAGLHPQLLWQRTSPAPQHMDGPVLYQIIFRGSNTTGVGTVPVLTAQHTLANSHIFDAGSALTFSEIVNFAPGQTFPGAGTITGVTAGTGLSGGGTSGGIALGIADGGVGTTQITSGAAPNGTVLAANGGGGVSFITLPANVPAWNLVGNAGTGCSTSPCAEFLGTSDNEPMEFHVNSQRALRVEPAVDGQVITGQLIPNMIGGSSANSVTANGSAGAVIAGGGAAGINANTVSGSFSTISGGLRNTVTTQQATVVGGFFNSASGFRAFVGGGRQNIASGTESTVAGGGVNTAGPNLGAAVGGGAGNTASGQQSTVSGGGSNTASGLASTVAGGLNDNASGDFSFAAGSSADTNGHRGAFVWGDASTGGAIQATADNQFVARATGGFQLVAAINGSGIPTKTVSIAATSGDVSIPGSLTVSGSITAGVKDFRVDDPIAPREKYLVHASIESSEMMNLYSGNAVLDRLGEAVVRLPAWMQAENTDFRYQLTCIAGFAPVYVAQEIHNNQFKIAGGRAGMKVSWLISGVRQDSWAKAHPMRVEQEKAPGARDAHSQP